MTLPEIRAEMRRLVLVEQLAIETVARKFGVHHSTVRRALRDVDAQPEPPTPSLLEPFKPYLVQRLLELPEITGARLFAEARERGFLGSIALLRRYVAQIRTPRPRKAYLRIECEPGEQAQVDWGSFGYLRSGVTQRPLSAFVMVLSWSRALFVDFSLDQRLETFLAMHQRALEFFGGVPKRILYDNLKSVVLHHIGSTIQFNPRFLTFAGHHLFEPNAAPVRYPQAKGRVESSIKYLRHSFFYGRSFSSLADLRQQAASWRDHVANQRIHATTRERPADRLLVERPRLRALPDRPYDTDLTLPLIVSKQASVKLDTNSYSVPSQYVGKTVQLRADDTAVRVLCDGAVIANHVRCWDRRRAIEDPAHIADLIATRPGASRSKQKERLANLSPAWRLYLQEIARRRIHLGNEVQKLLRLAHLYSDAELMEGITQAMANKTFGARYVRALMDQARFKKGLPEPAEPITTGNPVADSVEVEPHNMESYDALFKQPANDDPNDTEP